MQIRPSYHLAGASPLPLDVGYLLTAAPAPTILLGFLRPWTWGMVFPGVMYGCESQTIKKIECQRIDAFELWCWGEDS